MIWCQSEWVTTEVQIPAEIINVTVALKSTYQTFKIMFSYSPHNCNPSQWISIPDQLADKMDGFPQYWILVCVIHRCFPFLPVVLLWSGYPSHTIDLYHDTYPYFSVGKGNGANPRLGWMFWQWAIACTIQVFLLSPGSPGFRGA